MAAENGSQNGRPSRFLPLWGWLLLAAFVVVAATVAAVLVWQLFGWFRSDGPETPLAIATAAESPSALVTVSPSPTLLTETPVPPVVPSGTATSPTASPTAVAATAVPATPVPPTPAPPTPTPGCDYSMAFVADVTIPDNSVVQPGTGFLKTWRIRNNGTCAWPYGATWAFAGGNQMGGPNAVPAPAAIPGEVVDISVYLIAPTTPGSYSGYWTLRLPDGQTVQQRFYVRISVPALPTPIPPPPTPTSLPPTASWAAEYFGNPNLTGQPIVVRNDADINFAWGQGTPATSVPADGFSARWRRSISLPQTGAYQFFATADDGVRIWVDDYLILDEWHGASNETYIAQVNLASGGHVVRVDYFEDWGEARVHVWWQAAAPFPQWQGEYWPNTNLSGTPALVRNDPSIDFEWGSGSPAANLPADNFSARWTQTFDLNAGNYHFTAEIDDGLRLYVGQTLVIDAWQDGNRRQVTGDIWLAGGSYPLRVEFYERTGDALVRLGWQLSSGYPDWQGEYWPNTSLSGSPALVRNDTAVAFDWADGPPAPSLPADRFSARWSREVDLASGTYRLYALADDGVRVYVNGQLLINEWHQGGSGTTYQAEIVLPAGRHTLVVEYFEELFLAEIQFWYERLER